VARSGAGASGAFRKTRLVLHVGSTVDRKNVPLVIQTMVRLRQQTDAYLSKSAAGSRTSRSS